MADYRPAGRLCRASMAESATTLVVFRVAPYHRRSNNKDAAMRERTIASHFVRAALRRATRQGLDGPALLRRAGIQPALLDEPRARIAPEQFTRLMQLLWEVLDDEYMGFGEVRSKRGTFAMMCHTLIHCRTLEKALQRGELFYGLFPRRR